MTFMKARPNRGEKELTRMITLGVIFRNTGSYLSNRTFECALIGSDKRKAVERDAQSDAQMSSGLRKFSRSKMTRNA